MVSRQDRVWQKSAAVLAGLAAVCFASPSLAATAGANGNARVLQPTTLTSLLELNFGTIATNGNGGTIKLDASDSSRTCAVGMVCLGNFDFALLSVTGNAASSVQITYSASTQLNGPGSPMTVVLQFPGGSGAVLPLTNGSALVKFGADLNVNTNQLQGTYTGQFSVNVNYQ